MSDRGECRRGSLGQELDDIQIDHFHEFFGYVFGNGLDWSNVVVEGGESRVLDSSSGTRFGGGT
jgi:hypothetical protein